MCEANAYLYKDEQEELFMEMVDKVVPGNGEIYLENIFGQRKTLAGRIKELNLVNHRIILEESIEEPTLAKALEDSMQPLL